MSNTRNLKVREAINLFDNFKQLNGREEVAELTGSDGTAVKKLITTPYDIEEDAVWNISKNLRILKEQILVLEDVKERIAKEVAPDGFEQMGDIEKTEKVAEINRRLDKYLDKEIEVNGLLTIKFKDLNVKKNMISAGLVCELGEFVTRE